MMFMARLVVQSSLTWGRHRDGPTDRWSSQAAYRALRSAVGAQVQASPHLQSAPQLQRGASVPQAHVGPQLQTGLQLQEAVLVWSFMSKLLGHRIGTPGI